jgi:hypothetical protein
MKSILAAAVLCFAFATCKAQQVDSIPSAGYYLSRAGNQAQGAFWLSIAGGLVYYKGITMDPPTRSGLSNRSIVQGIGIGTLGLSVILGYSALVNISRAGRGLKASPSGVAYRF